MELAGKRALVTGGGTGIGFGCARRLLEHGAEVLIVGRRDDVLQDALERLRKNSRHQCKQDHSKKDDIREYHDPVDYFI